MNATAYTNEDINLTQAEYSRWVKPQLFSIGQDYRTLMSLLNPHLEDLKLKFSLYQDLLDESQSLQTSCDQTSAENCIKKLNDYINKLGNLIKNSDEVELTETFSDESNRENSLLTFHHYSIYMSSLQELFFQFLNYKFFIEAGIPPLLKTEVLIKKIEDSFNSFNFYLLSTSDPQFTLALTAYWNSFIKPLQAVVLKESDKSHFLRRLNDFNLRWNILHVELTKRNKKVSNQVITLLNTMHNRWKIILRVTLR